jgi:hypothetical protein
MTSLRFNRLDCEISKLWWGCNCGPIVLAAILGIRLGDVRRLVPEFSEKRSITYELMKTALDRTGRPWMERGVSCPPPGSYGLVIIDFGNKAHWVAIWNSGAGLKAFDAFSMRWMSLHRWASWVLPWITRGQDCERRCVIEVPLGSASR